MTESKKSVDAEETAAAAVACELSDEALEAAAEMISSAHGTGHPPMC